MNEGSIRATAAELLRLLGDTQSAHADIIERSRRIVTLWRRHDFDQKLPAFLKFLSIDSQTDHLPKGEVRGRWNPEALKRADIESAEYESCLSATFENARVEMANYLKERFSK